MLQTFHYYTYDREFAVITDHQPLTKLFSSRDNLTPRFKDGYYSYSPTIIL